MDGQYANGVAVQVQHGYGVDQQQPHGQYTAEYAVPHSTAPQQTNEYVVPNFDAPPEYVPEPIGDPYAVEGDTTLQ